MKRLNRILFLGLCALAGACSTTDTRPQPPAPTVTSSMQNTPGNVVSRDVVQMSAIVDAIDYDTRMVTLRDSDGKSVTFRVSEAARNLSQVKKGDRVDATYYRSVAVQLRKPGEATPGVSSGVAAGRAEPGETPGAAGVQSVTVTATIRALDRANQTATLEGPDGQLTTIAVRNPAHFDVASVGDLVEITYTEAVAISVEKRARRRVSARPRSRVRGPSHPCAASAPPAAGCRARAAARRRTGSRRGSRGRAGRARRSA